MYSLDKISLGRRQKHEHRRPKLASLSLAALALSTSAVLSGCGLFALHSTPKASLGTSVTNALVDHTKHAHGGSPVGTNQSADSVSTANPATASTASTAANTSTASSGSIAALSNTTGAPSFVTTGADTSAKVTVNSRLWVPVLMYHDITYLPKNSLGMSAVQFDSEMTWLHGHGFHPVTLNQLYNAMYHGGSLPTHPVVITFDDGYESVYQNAFPELKKYQFPATVFMISGAVGHRGKFPMLTWQELSTMQASGLVAIESHTVHHIDLSLASPATQQAELVDSARTLESHLHHPVLYFCYPSSRYNTTTMKDLKADGYLLAFTEHRGYASALQGPYQLHRIRMWEDMPLADFAGVFTPSVTSTSR